MSNHDRQSGFRRALRELEEELRSGDSASLDEIESRQYAECLANMREMIETDRKIYGNDQNSRSIIAAYESFVPTAAPYRASLVQLREAYIGVVRQNIGSKAALEAIENVDAQIERVDTAIRHAKAAASPEVKARLDDSQR